MDHFTYVDGAMQVEQVPMEAIAQAVGTPVYVYDQRALEAAADEVLPASGPSVTAAPSAVGFHRVTRLPEFCQFPHKRALTDPQLFP